MRNIRRLEKRLDGHREILHGQFTICMVWTEEDTKDVIKKILATVIAAILVSVLYALYSSLTLEAVLVILVVAGAAILFVLLRARSLMSRVSEANEGEEASRQIGQEDHEPRETVPTVEIPASDARVEVVMAPESRTLTEDTRVVEDFEQHPKKVQNESEIPGVKKKELTGGTEDKGTKIDVLYEGVVEVERQESLHFDLLEGDVVEGTLKERDGQSFDCYIIDERNYPRFSSTREGRIVKEFMDDSSYFVKWQVRRAGVWYIVFDLYGKQNPRSIEVSLRCTSLAQ